MSPVEFQLPVLTWEDGSTLRQAQRGASLTTGFGLVEPCIAVHAVLGQAGVKCAHGVTVRVPQGDDMGVTEAVS